ncbi:MAG: hypothetical protein ACYDEJ_03040, partial [Desulfitobacteriaceae bacterium]
DQLQGYNFGVVPAMAFCKSEEFTIAKVGNSFCNFVLFHYAINMLCNPKKDCTNQIYVYQLN